MSEVPNYRDYYRGDLPPPSRDPSPPLEARPGEAIVRVIWVNEETWDGSWEDIGSRDQAIQGTKEEVLAWARSRPAATRLIFDQSIGDWVPLD